MYVSIRIPVPAPADATREVPGNSALVLSSSVSSALPPPSHR